MGETRQRSSEDTVMVAVLAFAVVLGLLFGLFTVVSIATHAFNRDTGLMAVAAFVTYTPICYGALRKRMEGSGK